MNEISYERQRVIRLLRCTRTNRYFSGGGWTEHLESAKVFNDVMEVARACVQHGLAEVELVLRAGAGNAELFATPVR